MNLFINFLFMECQRHNKKIAGRNGVAFLNVHFLLWSVSDKTKKLLGEIGYPISQCPFLYSYCKKLIYELTV
jgi:hypothetical protein